MDKMKLWVMVIVFLLLLCQSSWLYSDARKRSRYPWIWAIWGLIQFPMPLFFYWLIILRRKKRK
ncbi:transcriptional regulator [Paenibacillus sp. ATY16]|uniref:transcriptional regulator n=1 Tax=Paenibacillus sp. ATY16 TaxID=1759312 RepID=UPI00200D2228|nr:transcriptional regulator [Paenibacillus sp. ATY16]